MSDEMQVQTKGLNKKFLFIAIALIAAGLVVALVLLLPTSAKAKKVEEQLDLGAKYLSELNYEQAIVAYEAVIKIDPKCEEAYLALADIYIATGEFEKAEEILKQAEEAIGADATEAISNKKKEVENLKEEQNRDETSTPMNTLTPSSTPEAEVSPINQFATAEIGDVVKFGRFVQNGYVDIEQVMSQAVNRDALDECTDEIEWYVLDRKDDKILLFSKYVLDTKPYHNESTEITWNESSLREWLNNTFYNFAFSEEEKRYICQTKLSNSDNEEWGTEGGVATTDNVFLLSIEEAKEYFNFTYDSPSMDGFEDYRNSGLDERLIGIVTEYAMINGSSLYAVEDSEDCSTWWYLRSMGRNNKTAAIVEFQGFINPHGYPEFTVEVPNGIRPAIWVDIAGSLCEGDIFDLTDGEDDGDVRLYHSLKADVKNLLTYDEITFLGHSIVDLDIDTARSLMEEKDYDISCNLEWEDPSETDFLWISGWNRDRGSADITAMQYFDEDYVCLWSIGQYTHNNEMKTPVGARNINMHDTFGEVLEKMGFDNAYEVEADIQYCFEQVFLNDGEMGDKDWNIFSGMIEFGQWDERVRVSSSSGWWENQEQEIVSYEIEVYLYDSLFQEQGDKRYNLSLNFECDENTNGKLILTDYSMHVNEAL